MTSMTTWACILAGVGLVASAIALARLRPPQWNEHAVLADADRRAISKWMKFQKGVRWLNNILIGLIGVAIAVSPFVPRGRPWMLTWIVILVALILCVLLAMLDAFSSLAGYRRVLPEVARQNLGEEN